MLVAAGLQGRLWRGPEPKEEKKDDSWMAEERRCELARVEWD